MPTLSDARPRGLGPPRVLLEGLAALGPGTWPLEQICRASASGTEPGHASQVLAGLAATGLCTAGAADDSWLCEYAPAELQRLAQVLNGADHFRRMRLNPATIELAVTMPLVPSHLEKELAATLGRPGGFLTTSVAFSRLAQAASRRLVVMTPFIDAGGFRWLRRVFEATPADCQKIVVLRNTDQYTVELGVQHADWLRTLQVSVRDYHLSHAAIAAALCRSRPSTPNSSSRTTHLPMWDQPISSIRAKGCHLKPGCWSMEAPQFRWQGSWTPCFVSRGRCEFRWQAAFFRMLNLP